MSPLIEAERDRRLRRRMGLRKWILRRWRECTSLELETSSLTTNPSVGRKHTALMKRVTEAVSSDSKVSAFKSAGKFPSDADSQPCRKLTFSPSPVRGFRSSEMAAEDLVDTLGHIFDHQLDVTNGIITTLAELLDDVEKRQYLLTAWQDVQIQVRRLVFARVRSILTSPSKHNSKTPSLLSHPSDLP